MVMGQPHYFQVFGDNCGARDCIVDGAPVTVLGRQSHVELTTTDAYADGGLFLRSFGPDDGIVGRDVRFEAVFVPEPSTYALLAAGLGALALLRCRRSSSTV